MVYMLPASGIGLRNSLLYQLVNLNFSRIGGIDIWTPSFIFFIAIVELLLFSVLSMRPYCKHEVV